MEEVITRKCAACGNMYPMNDTFFHHTKNIHHKGFTHRCKSCSSNRQATRGEYNRSYYERTKDRFKERAAQNYTKKKEQYRAREKVRRAVQNGTLYTTPCVNCGDENAEAHHPNYSRPLEVIWLCRKHHRIVHPTKPKTLRINPTP